MDIDWSSELADQLDWHWQNHLRPRLDGLTDEEYFWEPVPGCWSLRKRGTETETTTVGSGDYLYEFVYPEPPNPPVTTIAWRLAHVIVGVFAARNASHFGGPPASWRNFNYAATATEALAQLDDVVRDVDQGRTRPRPRGPDPPVRARRGSICRQLAGPARTAHQS